MGHPARATNDVDLGEAYCVQGVIGEGTMGVVYAARQLRLGRRVAVKVIRRSFAREALWVTRFEREARFAAQVRSDHVAQVFDLVRTQGGRPAIVMERLDGHTLRQELEMNGPLPLPHALRIGMQICRAAAAMHARGLVHRDLKPSNVFLAERGDGSCSVKILDFGLTGEVGQPHAHAVASEERSWRPGTPAYMAPEQPDPDVPVHPTLDVYAIGAMLHRMLTGAPLPKTHPPEKRQSPSDVKDTHDHPALHPEVEAILLRATASRPEDRPSTAWSLSRMLREIEAGLDSKSRDSDRWDDVLLLGSLRSPRSIPSEA